MLSEDVASFTAVDETQNPTFFVQFLDAANKLPATVAAKPMIFAGLKLRGAEHVLDVGCGAGTDVFDLASRVGPAGHVTGVDLSAAMIDEARRRTAGRGLPVFFEIADAQALPFADETFDAVRAERLLMHVPDARQAIAEMTRVLRKGGRMAVFDVDWGTQFCDSRYREVTRKIAQSFCDDIRNGWIGRELPRLFRDHRMIDVSVKYHTVNIPYEFLRMLVGGHVDQLVATGSLAETEARGWWEELEQASCEGNFLYGFTTFIVSGMKG